MPHPSPGSRPANRDRNSGDIIPINSISLLLIAHSRYRQACHPSRVGELMGCSYTGDVAALNHRLMSVNPPGSAVASWRDASGGLHPDLVQQIGMTVEQVQELVERLPLPGFAPLVPGKGADATAKDLSRFFLTQSQLLPDSPHLRRQQRPGSDAGPEASR